jgi:steroid delta-isomerase-like uncharacterized protein
MDTKKKKAKVKMIPLEVVRAYIDAYNKNDLNGALAYVADDFVRFSNTSKIREPMNREDWADMWARFQVAFPGFKWDVTSMVASGDTVAIEVIESGTFSKPWALPGMTIQPTGKSYSSRNSLFFQVNKDGLIQNYRQYASTAFLDVGIKEEDITKTY